MFNMDQKWDDQVKKMVDTLKHRGLQLSRSKLKHYHKRAIEESKISAAIKYALQVVQTNKTLTGGLMAARNPCLKAITGLPNCTDNDFCFLPKDKGGLGYEAAQPMFSPISAQALVNDLNDLGRVGQLTSLDDGTDCGIQHSTE